MENSSKDSQEEIKKMAEDIKQSSGDNELTENKQLETKTNENGEKTGSGDEVHTGDDKPETKPDTNQSDKQNEITKQSASHDDVEKQIKASENSVEEGGGEGEDQGDGGYKKRKLGFTDYFSLITSCYSLVSYLLDVGTDIDLVLDYKNRGMIGYFWATLACVVIPHILLVITDIEMLWEDRKNRLEWEKGQDGQGETEEEGETNEVEKGEGQTEAGLKEEKEGLLKDDGENLKLLPISDANTNGVNGHQSPEDTETVASISPKKGCCNGKFGCLSCVSWDFTGSTPMYVFRIILGLLGLGIIVRKLQRLYYKFKAASAVNEEWMDWYDAKTLEAQRDSSNLAFICAFTENCPQSLLQLYIYVRDPVPLYTSIGRSIITSILNLPLSYANYYRATRRQPKDEEEQVIRPDLHHVAFFFYYLGLLGAVVARMLCIGLFIGTVSVKFGLIVLAVHFIVTVLFIHFYQKPPFAGLAIGENKCSIFFSVSVNTLLYSLVNLFLFVDLNDRTGKRWRILTNNVLIYLENYTFLILSFALAHNEYAMIYGLIVAMATIIHFIMLSNFYMFLHPSVGLCFNCAEKEEPAEAAENNTNDVEAGGSTIHASESELK